MRKNYNAIFQQRFESLNAAQQQAVQTIEGPVMVIAGPGTGKTEILAARIAYILQQDTGADPNNILCLTFTESGAFAMRKRLEQFIGAVAYQVQIHTFHSFCNQIIQENLERFGKRELDLVSELEVIEFLQRRIQTFSADHPLFHVSSDYHIKKLIQVFRTIKSENWDIKELIASIDDYLKDLPHREQYQYKRSVPSKNIQAGDVKQHEIDKEIKKCETLKAAIHEFPHYQNFLKEQGRYDYEDMIVWILHAFESDPEFLLSYQEQFLYTLVDEYQDTNGSQNRLLELLTSYWDAPNIFIVGDDDQSIFRFQGANLRNILSFHKRYTDTISVIVLKENYRSSQNILDVSGHFVSNNHERLIHEFSEFDKSLQAKNNQYALSVQKPIIREYSHILQEENSIIQEIEDVYKQGYDVSHIAIIYREHRQAKNIVQILEQRGIPVNVRESVNIFTLPLIQNILVLIEYIVKEKHQPYSAEDLLFHILYMPFWGIAPKSIALLYSYLQAVKKRNKADKQKATEELSLFGLETQEIQYMRDIISNPIHLSSVSGLEDIQQILDFYKFFEQSLQNTTTLSLLEQVQYIINTSGILDFACNDQNKEWHLRTLKTFFDFLKAESAKQPYLLLDGLLHTCQQMVDHNIQLSLEQATIKKKGVNFLTAHASKGLEFEKVYIIGCTARVWEKKKKNANNAYIFPDTVILSTEGNDLEESRRLFYVAMTRAKEYLILSYSLMDEKEKDTEKTQFIAEIMEQDNTYFEQIVPTEEQNMNYLEDLVRMSHNHHQENIAHEYLQQLLENYRLNVSHLNKYLRCPISFYYENLLKVPMGMNEYMSFGNAVHYALEHFFRTLQTDKTVEKLLHYFELGMKYKEHSFTRDQFSKRMTYGKKILKTYYETYKDGWDKKNIVEYNINNVVFHDVPLSGKIDRIEIDHNTAHVIDYKTGRYSNGRKKLQRPNDEQPLGGDYWRQLVFYKILLDAEKKKNWNMLSAEMNFVESEDESPLQRVKMIITDSDIDIVGKQIETVYRSIMNREFSQGCGEEDCKWCQLHKSLL